MNYLPKFCILLLVCWISAISRPLYEYAGGSSALYLRAETGTRPAAMAGAYTALASGEYGIFYNPAGLSQISGLRLTMDHTQWFEDIRMDNLVLGYRPGDRFGVAAAVFNMGMPSIPARDAAGLAAGKVDVASSFLNFAVGFAFTRSLAIGVGLKYFHEQLADYSSNGWAVDAGLLFKTAVPGLRVGFAVRNMGSGVKFDSVNEDLPVSYRLGLAYVHAGRNIRLALDLVKARDTSVQIKSGMEYLLSGVIALRLGNIFSGQSMWDPTLGAGLIVSRSVQFDYAFYMHRELGTTHRLGISLSLDQLFK